MKMKHFIGRLFLILAVLACCISMTDPNVGFTIESIETENFPEISLRISVWEPTGAAIKTLDASDFLIQEEGGAPLTPSQLRIDTDSPLSVALVLDISGSMIGKALEDAQVAAARFIDRLGTTDQVALVAFSEDVNPDPDQLKAQKEYGFTQDFKAIYDVVEGLEAGGGTELYNALQKAIALTAQLPEGHRAVLLLSDGVNEPANVGDPELPIQMAKEFNIPIFIIGLGYNTDEAYLNRLASETGGIVRFAPRSSELAQTFREIADTLKTQYVLTYQSQLTEAGPEVSADISLNISGHSLTKKIVLPGIDQRISSLALQTGPSADPTDQADIAEAPGIETEPPAPHPTVQATHIPEEDPAAKLMELLKIPWTWLGLLSLSAVLIFFLVQRKKKPPVIICARCGYKLDKADTTCPECGETRKM